MIRATRLVALFVAIIGVHSLLAQEPKKELPKGLPTFGDFKSIDLDKKTITVETGFGTRKETKTFPLADRFDIRATRNTAMLKPADIAVGDRLALTIDATSQKVTEIRISKGAAVIEAPRGAFKEVDLVKKTITIVTGTGGFGGGGIGKQEDKSFPLGDSIVFNVGFKKDELIKLTDLIPGDQLALTLDPASKKVTQISVQAARPSGTIKEIDVEKKFIVIEPLLGKGQEVRLPLGDKVTVEKYFRNIPIGEVKPGMHAFVTLGDDRKSVSHMMITENNAVRLLLGNIQAIDAAKRTITIGNVPNTGFGGRPPKEPITYKIAENAGIKIAGMDGKLTDLETGINITAFAEKDTIVGLSVLFSTGRHGTIAKIDVKTSTVTIKVYDETVTCVVTLDTKIQQSRKDIALADLKEGQEVTFKLSADKKKTESITVRTSFRP
jgi:predicted RNA-binding protein